MRIAVDAERAFADAPTGTETYAAELLRRLPILGAGHRFTYFVRRAPKVELPKNVTVEVLRWPMQNLWHQLRLSLRLLRGGFDVLFVPAHTVPLVHRVPTVTTVHDIGFIDAPELYGDRPLARGLVGGVANAALRVLSLGRFGANELDYHRWSLTQALRCAAVITVSKFSAERVQVRFPQHPPIVPVHNGLTERALPSSEPPIRSPYVLYVGRLERKKNLLGLLRVFQRYLEVQPRAREQLVLAGSPGLGFSDVAKLLETDPLRSRVVLTGYLNDTALGAYLAHARAFLFLPHYEGFGMPVLEAMAARVPVVASDIPALREVAGEAAVFVDPRDLDTAARALASVIHDTPLREALVKAGSRRAERFRWDEAAKRTLEVLTTVGEGREVPGALLN